MTTTEVSKRTWCNILVTEATKSPMDEVFLHMHSEDRPDFIVPLGPLCRLLTAEVDTHVVVCLEYRYPLHTIPIPRINSFTDAGASVAFMCKCVSTYKSSCFEACHVQFTVFTVIRTPDSEMPYDVECMIYLKDSRA